jgi:hypothetical protein
MDGNQDGQVTVGRLTAAIAVASLLALGWACDSKKDAPPPGPPATVPTLTTQPAAGAAPAATRPTTQELISAPRKSLVLGGFPLRLDVPPGWKLTTVGTATYLEGEAPHGEVRIQLVPQGQYYKPDTVAAMEKQARAQAAADPENVQVIPLRGIGGTAKMMERREIQHLTVRRDDGKDEKVDRMEWMLRVFVPQEPDYGVDVLSFTGLSVEQYKQDKEFLEGVLKTLRYDASGGALD